MPRLSSGTHTGPSVSSSVSTIRNQRYHIHANLSFAVLVAQVLLLISFRMEPGTVSRCRSSLGGCPSAPRRLFRRHRGGDALESFLESPC